jgi:hypothetical protein
MTRFCEGAAAKAHRASCGHTITRLPRLDEHHGQHLPRAGHHHDPELARPLDIIHGDRSRNCRNPARGDCASQRLRVVYRSRLRARAHDAHPQQSPGRLYVIRQFAARASVRGRAADGAV